LSCSNKQVFSKTIKTSLRLFYDNIGFLILINLVCCLFSSSIILFPAAFISVFYIIRNIIINNEDENTVKNYVKQIFTSVFRKSFLFMAAVFLLFIFSYVLFFYTHIVVFNNFISLILTGISFWSVLIYLSFLLYFLPLIENREFYKVKNKSKAIFFALLKYPLASSGIVLFLIIVNLIIIFSAVGCFLFTFTFNAMVLGNLSYIVFCESLGEIKKD
jgi:hypothetical protein